MIPPPTDSAIHDARPTQRRQASGGGSRDSPARAALARAPDGEAGSAAAAGPRGRERGATGRGARPNAGPHQPHAPRRRVVTQTSAPAAVARSPPPGIPTDSCGGPQSATPAATHASTPRTQPYCDTGQPRPRTTDRPARLARPLKSTSWRGAAQSARRHPPPSPGRTRSGLPVRARPRAEQALEGGVRAVEAALDRADARLEHRRQVVVGEVLEVAEHHHRAQLR